MIVATLVLALQPCGWIFIFFFFLLVSEIQEIFSGIALSKCCLKNIPLLQMAYLSFKLFILFLR